MEDEQLFFEKNPMLVLDHQSLDILDVNDVAIRLYGYSREEFLSMNVNDLGTKYKRTDLVPGAGGNNSTVDKIWEHRNSDGEALYVQYTHHTFNYGGRPVKLAVLHDVTELVDRQESNRYRYPQVDTHRANVPLAEIEWDNQRRVKNWSERAEELFGWREDEVVGVDGFFERFIHQDELEKANEVIEEAIKSKRPGYSVEGRVYSKSGKILFCEWYNSMLFDQEGQVVSVSSLVHDISERKESEYLFRALSEESLVGVYLIQDGVFKYVNPRFATIFHYRQEEIEHNKGPLDLAHPEDRHIVDNHIRRRIIGHSASEEYDFRALTKDDQVIHVNVYGTAITYLGRPAILGTLVDITDSTLALERYRASVESFEDLFDSISDAIYIQNRNGVFIEVNESAVKLNGYDRDFLLGNTPDVLAAPGKVDLEETHRHFEKALNGEVQRFEQWGIRKNGEVFPEEVILNPGTYFGENVVIAIARDISEQYEAEEQLRKSEELFRQLFQNSPIGIVLMDERQEIRRINGAFTDLFGYTSEEVRGLDIDHLIVPADEKEAARKISEKIFGGETSNLSATRLRKDGSRVEVLIYGVPVNVNEKTIAIYGLYVDITERKQAEEQVRKSLREKEVLLAEIHHRVKNNLAVITGLLELQAYSSKSDGARSVLKESQMRINSIALIHEKLYQNDNLSEISFDVYIRELSEVILSSMETEERDIKLDIQAEPIHLTVNQAIPCGLILNELITNAFKHAFPERQEGRIIIELSREGTIVTLKVSDDGVGMPEDLDLKEPSSLGLTLIRTLSRQLNGAGRFENHRGTAFSVRFDQ